MADAFTTLLNHAMRIERGPRAAAARCGGREVMGLRSAQDEADRYLPAFPQKKGRAAVVRPGPWRWVG